MEGNKKFPNIFIYLVKVIILFVVYFITARIGLSFDAVSGFATLVWPPTGISLAALLLFGRSLWPGIFLAAFLVNFSVGASVFVALGIAVGNTLSSITAAYLFNRLTGFNNLERLRCVLIFIAVSFSTTVISATIGTSSLFVGGTVSLSGYFDTWWAWWVGDTLGILLVGSLLLLNWKAILRTKLNYRTLLHFLSIELFLILGSLIAFWGVLDSFSIIIFYLIFSPLIWAALRFGQPGGVVAIFSMTFIAIWGAINGYGPFSEGLLSENLLTLQLFMGSVAVNIIILGAVISELKADQEELKSLNKAKSEFISIASHQLRTPVTAIKWLIELASNSAHNLTSKEQEYFKDLAFSVDRLSKLVEDLLNVSRIELGTLDEEKTRIDIIKFTEDFIKDIKPYAILKKHEIEFKKEAGNLIIDMNSKMLYNVLLNLTSNAIDYSPQGTTVTIKIESKSDRVRVLISNKGPTIPLEEQAKLFQKFYRGESTKKMKTEGTGLGLYIVKANVEKAGGSVGLVSEKDKDTVFWFELPLMKNP